MFAIDPKSKSLSFGFERGNRRNEIDITKGIELTYVLGTQIPDAPVPHVEICHTFVYRWLIASGIYSGNYSPSFPNPQECELNGATAKPLLFPVISGHDARRIHPTPPWVKTKPRYYLNGVKVERGSIVGFWNGANLSHSMIAITPSSWIGVNNQGCFGVGMGRKTVNDVPHFSVRTHRCGWLDSGNVWMTPFNQQLTVTYLKPRRRRF